jgi:predicted ATPase/DNA-binding XRE family transcriptional regulator
VSGLSESDRPGSTIPGGAGLASFGERLRRERVRAGLTQEDLADRSGLTPAAVSQLERGTRRRPHQHTVRALADALGLADSDRAALIALARGLAPNRPPDSPPRPAPTPTRPTGPHSMALGAATSPGIAPLPASLTPLVGREAEVEAVREMLDPTRSTVRLLTLLGPGGVGKTRLGLAVAAAQTDAYPDGVAFVDLAPLHDARLAPVTIARVLGVSESAGRSARELLLDYLQTRAMLLVLDNFEHLLGAAPLLVDLLEGCPRLVLLVTSRSALWVSGEHQYVVAPLTQPAAEPVSVEAVATAPAVRLFMTRAQAVAPDFALNAATAPAVAAICRRLDGLPLAIELAAARVRVLTTEQIAARLDDRFHLLTRGSRTALPRQQTLRASLDWSHDLLGPEERALLRRLAAFAGGWTLEAAEAVCTGADVAAGDVFERLGVLLDNSLVQRLDDAGSEPRFGMLETVREYARERLTASGEQGAVQRSHWAYFLGLARSARRGMLGPDQATWVQRLELEHHNLRAALTWALAADEAELALQLCGTLTTFWYIRGYYREGRDWSARALAAAPEAAAATRAAVLFGAANLADIQRDHAEARSLIEASVALWRTVGNRRGLASSLAVLGMLARHDRDWTTARTACEEALAIYDETPEPWGQRLALGVLGWVAEDQGDHATAQRLLEASLAVARTGGSPIDIALQLNNLGIVAIRQGDDREAAARHREALQLTRNVDAREPMAGAFEGLAAVAAARHNYRFGAWLLGAATELRAQIGSPRIAQFAEEYGRLQPLLNEVLGDDAFGAATATGAAAPLSEVLAATLADEVQSTS